MRFDKACPVIFDNDDPRDCYSDEFMMAAASLGEIDCKGIITTSSHDPYNSHVPEKEMDDFHPEKLRNRDLAAQSGLKRLPEFFCGVKGNLEQPASGKPEDTRPIDTPGSRRIMEVARGCTPEKPLVILVGGPVSTVVDAWLLDKSIADKMIVAFHEFSDDYAINGYNSWADGWASVTAFQKLRMVRYYSVHHNSIEYDPEVPKERLKREIPECPLKPEMVAKDHPHNVLPDERDVDCVPGIHFMRDDYVLESRRQSFSHTDKKEGHIIPVLKDDPDGNTVFVTKMNRSVATEEWWRVMKTALRT